MLEPGYDCIVYGMVCLDTIWRARAWPPAGGYARVLEERHTVGGEAANSAIALARWGVRVALVGNAIGEDDDGRCLRDLLARETPELDTRFLAAVPEAATPAFVCIATEDGHRTTFGRRYDGLRWPALDSALARSARLFTLDGNGREAAQAACAVAAEAGLPIIAQDCARNPAINALASLVVTSYEHVGAEKPREEHATFAAAIRDAHGTTAIVTLGENGCLIAEANGDPGAVTHLPAYVAPEVVDSTGSGDIFRAGLVYGRLQGWDLQKTARFASAAAALNCGAMGGWRGVRSIAEIERFQRTAATR
jgi:sugar/nucleoside kinase (ribokinase family)